MPRDADRRGREEEQDAHGHLPAGPLAHAVEPTGEEAEEPQDRSGSSQPAVALEQLVRPALLGQAPAAVGGSQGGEGCDPQAEARCRREPGPDPAALEQLRQEGTVRRGWLGVRIQTVTEELAEGMRLDEPSGALVASVTEGGPAERAGIKQGDVILQFDGRTVPDMRKLPRMVAETPIGKDVDVVVWRKGEQLTVQVDLGELDDVALASATTGISRQ